MAPKAQWPKPRKSGVKPQSGWMTLEPRTFTLVEAAALEARGGRPQQSSWSSTGELLQEQRPLRRSSPWCPERQRARLVDSLPSMLMAQRRPGRTEGAAVAQIPVLSCAHVQPRPGTEQRLAFVHWGTSGQKSERSCGAGPPTLHPLAGRPFTSLPEPMPRSHSAALLDAESPISRAVTSQGAWRTRHAGRGAPMTRQRRPLSPVPLAPWDRPVSWEGWKEGSRRPPSLTGGRGDAATWF